jgi:hypothetical protein
MFHEVLDWQKIFKIVLDKAFFFILWPFYLFCVLLSKKAWEVKILFFEIGHIVYKKNREFYADLKMQTYRSDKMPPKKGKIKNVKNGT